MFCWFGGGGINRTGAYSKGGNDFGLFCSTKARLIVPPANYECRSCNLGANKFVEDQALTAEMAVTPPSIRKSAPTTYAESSDAR